MVKPWTALDTDDTASAVPALDSELKIEMTALGRGASEKLFELERELTRSVTAGSDVDWPLATAEVKEGRTGVSSDADVA